MNKHKKKGESSINNVLMVRATKADWKQVRESTGLSHVQIHHYRTGKRLTHQIKIEQALAKAIAQREKREILHQKKIASMLRAYVYIEEDIVGVAEHMSKKYDKVSK